MFNKRKIFQKINWLLIFLLVVSLSVLSGLNTLAVNNDTNLNQIEEGHRLFENGQYQESIKILEMTLKNLPKTETSLAKVALLTNLALAYEKLGQLDKVGQYSTESIDLLKTLDESPATLNLMASNLNIQGLWQLKTGHSEKAFTIWQQSEQIYQKVGDYLAQVQVEINQAQALQSLGFYRRAFQSLSLINQNLAKQPDSITKLVAERSLANTLQLVGDLEESEKILKDSLAIAQHLSLNNEISNDLFALGNLNSLMGIRANSFDDPAGAQEQFVKAYQYYEQSLLISNTLSSNLSIYTNQIGILINLLELQSKNPDLEQDSQIKPLVEIKSILEKIIPLFQQSSPSRSNIYSEINLVKNLTRLQIISKNSITIEQIRNVLLLSLQQAQELGDERAQAYALGYSGALLAAEQKYTQAQDFTQQALILADTINAKDIAYQWQWQLGRILKKQSKVEEAMIAYAQAIENLQALRSDLIVINPEVQFTFTEQIEPIYREYIQLLLRDNPNENRLIEAARILDSLQLAELENFFRSTCLDAHPVDINQVIDNIDPTAAIIYPIVISDRFEIILKLPRKNITHYSTSVDNLEKIEGELNHFVEILQQQNSDPQEILKNSQKIYDYLLRPLEKDLVLSEAKTLVFVLDSKLRNIPMAALHDGKRYLVEKYNLSLIPQLYLLQSKPLIKKDLKILLAGLTKPSGGFVGLPHVSDELSAIRSKIPNNVTLLNEEFTNKELQKKINTLDFPLLHLATHGQFSSQLEKTFILTWNDKLNANQLSELLKSLNGKNNEPLELLVLSACQTLTGDKRASLGLAGIAVKAGARSTLATLWPINDEATSLLMQEFYEALRKSSITKAEALHFAQLALLKNSHYASPYYWAAYVLIGNGI